MAEKQKSVHPHTTSPSGDSGFGSSAQTPVEMPEGSDLTGKNQAGINGVSQGSNSDPDKIMPADNFITWKSNEAVKLRMGQGSLKDKPISVVTMFNNTIRSFPNATAMAVKRGGKWQKWNYKQYLSDVRTAAKGFIQLGLEPYHGLGIIGFNAPEWFISALGAIFSGGFAVGIYTTNTPEACQYVAGNCEANVLVVENTAQLKKIIEVWDQLPCLKAVVQYSGEVEIKHDNVYTWKQLMEIGKTVSEEILDARIHDLAANKCCSLIYTSGTTGNPKGVMLSHDNVTWTARMTGVEAKLNLGNEILISYLPLSHIAAQLLDMYIPLMYGAAVYFAQPDALKGSLVDTLKEVRPTAFLGVPRVWEKIHDKMRSVGKQTTGIKKKIATWAKDVGYRSNMAMMKGESPAFGFGIANALVFKKIRGVLGLDRCKFCLTGAAPIMQETLDYFMSLNIPLMEIYGMSESTGPHTVSFPWGYRITSVGKEFPGASTKLVDQDKEGNGEICMSGRHVFMGYLHMEDKTLETIDTDGWLHSGDIGKKDKDGYLFITGRIKELIITAGGENVAPVPIEDKVKEMLPVVSNCMLVGDKKKFLSLLITLRTEVDPETTSPLDQFTQEALEWCQERGSKSRTVTEVLENKDEAVLKGIQEGIDQANKHAESRAKKIQKWSVLPRDFSIPGGELGPTLKLKRPVVLSMYQDTIEAFYAE